MGTNVFKRIGVLSAALLFAGSALVASATGAGAAPARAAAVTTVFDLNGTFSDNGAARPRIRNVDDILTVDMSSQGRPTATGVVIDSVTILVTFPDDGTYTAKLQLPGTIRWSNSSYWYKTRPVPNVKFLTAADAGAVLNRNGFTLGSVTTFVDRSCDYIDLVGRQSPAAGAAAIPGSRVGVSIGTRPPTPCP